MKEVSYTLKKSRRLVNGIWELLLTGDTSAITAPGQFVNIALPGKFLRRPISIADWTEDGLTLLVKEAGEGTEELVRLPEGTVLDVLSGLGNGFELHLDAIGERPVLMSGGIGIAPMYGLAKRLVQEGRKPFLLAGFRTLGECPGAFYDKIISLGVQAAMATEDGSWGIRGFVTDPRAIGLCPGLGQAPGYVFACGPTPMLKAVHQLPQFSGGQFSFEARMACGFGACVGCTILTANGPKRVCKDGPVFRKEEIAW